jgi:hypothetical protein
MPVPTRSKLAIVAALIVFVNCLDLLSTLYASPDLANEWNILERQFGLGWAGIICAKIIGSLLAVAGYAYYLRHRDGCYPLPGATRSEFCRHLSFGRQATWLEMQAGIPIGTHLGVNLGYFWAGMQGLVLWVAVDNLLLSQGIVFPLRYYSETGYHTLQSMIVAALVCLRFYLGNYRRYVVMKPAEAVVHSLERQPQGLTEPRAVC